MGYEYNVIPFRPRRVEEFGGEQIDLSSLNDLEVDVLVAQCSERFMQAHRELEAARTEQARRRPDGGSA